jgi:hypothetical protein
MINSRKMQRAGHVARMGWGRKACRLLVGKAEGERPLERPRLMWEDNIKTDLWRDRTGGGGMTGMFLLGIGTSGELLTMR